MSSQIIEIPLERIIVGHRLRAVDADYVELLAASMAESGQHTPIEVSPADIDGDHRLIAGAHRVAAARMAGLASLRAVIFLGSADDEALREVDENLMRRELTELDRAVFMAKRAEIYERLYPQTKKGGDRRSDQNDKFVALIPQQASFSTETSKKLGFSERQVQRVLKRGRDIEPPLRALLAPTRWADHGATLDALVKLSPAHRRVVVLALTRDEHPAPGFGAARQEALGVRENVKTAAEQQMDRLIAVWGKAQERGVRKQFLRWVLGFEAMRAEADAILSEYEDEGGEARVLKAIGGRAA